MIRKILLASSVLVLVALTAGPAYAHSAPAVSPHTADRPQVSSQQICAQNGEGYCLNDWNGAGSGGVVNMYYSGYTNNNWQRIELSNYCGNGQVNENTSCPFPAGSGLNTAYNESYIYEIKSSVSGACIGTDIYSDVNLGACPPSSGGHGSNIWVAVGSDQSYEGYLLVNVYWSAQHGNSSAAFLQSGGSIGAQAEVIGSPSNVSVWNAP